MIRLFLALVLLLTLSTKADGAEPEGLLYCSESNITSTNPQRYGISTTASSLSYALYDRLLYMNPETKKISPGIAYLNEIKDNGTTYIFKLKFMGIAFHKNKLFTPTRLLNAHDIAFSFDRMINPDNPFYRPIDDFPFFKRSDLANSLYKVKALDNNTVAFYLKTQTNDLTPFLASDNAVILSLEYAQTILKENLPPETIDTKGIGSGPYRLDKYMHERFVRLVPFAPYHGSKPKLPALVIIHSNFSNKRLTQLFTGECHIITNPTPGQLYLLEKLNNKNVKIFERNSVIGTFLIFNTKNPSLDDDIKRRTIASILNLNEIKQMVFFEHGTLQSELNYQHNTLARKLLENYRRNIIKNIPHSGSLPQLRLTTPNLFMPLDDTDKIKTIFWLSKQRPLNLYVFEQNNLAITSHVRIAQIIKSNLEEYGINVNIKTYRTSTGLKKMRNGNFDMALINVFNNYDDILEPLVSCSYSKNSPNRKFFSDNFTNWCDKDLEDLFAQTHKEQDPLTEALLANDIYNIIAYQMPIVPLIYSFNKFVAVSSVKGTQSTPFGGMSFINAYMEPEDD